MDPAQRKRDPFTAPKYVETLAELQQHIHGHLANAGVADREAKRLSACIVDGLSTSYAGRQLYVPAGKHRATEARNAAMLNEYDPANSRESVRRLAAKYLLSEIVVYRCLATERARRLAALPH